MTPTHLADKSALARARHPVVAARLLPMLVDGLIATCAIVDLELGYSARSAKDHDDVMAERRALPSAPVNEAVVTRAIEVQSLLAHRGQHRRPLPDLLIAAAAELAGLAVLHYDRDFDQIAQVTGQRCDWIAPRGSLG